MPIGESWEVTIKFLKEKTNCRHEWVNVRQMGTTQSARILVSRLQIRYPEFCWAHRRRMIIAFYPPSPALPEYAREKNLLGRKMHGEEFTGDPSQEAKEEA